MKDALIQMIRDSGIPGVKAPEGPREPPKDQPYASGEVHMHIYEYWGCKGGHTDKLSVQVELRDRKNQMIGQMRRTQAGVSAPVLVKSSFEQELVITPEWHQGVRSANDGWIEFQLGDLKFDTRGKSGGAHCNWGGFDPRQGPTCWIDDGNGGVISMPQAVAINQIDCWFPAVRSFSVYDEIPEDLVTF
jgi:hypothetical protein